MSWIQVSIRIFTQFNSKYINKFVEDACCFFQFLRNSNNHYLSVVWSKYLKLTLLVRSFGGGSPIKLWILRRSYGRQHARAWSLIMDIGCCCSWALWSVANGNTRTVFVCMACRLSTSVFFPLIWSHADINDWWPGVAWIKQHICYWRLDGWVENLSLSVFCVSVKPLLIGINS